jgi:deoxyribonuclease V
MIACVDVDYRPTEAVAACALLHAWDDAVTAGDLVERISPVEPYAPGRFLRRELPCLGAVLAKVAEPLDVVVVDGYVWLGGADVPGLGFYLYEALGKSVQVVGVAKTRFEGVRVAREVLRGSSRRPLYVSAVGLEVDAAGRHVQIMHGAFRIPTILKHVDQLCRRA